VRAKNQLSRRGAIRLLAAVCASAGAAAQAAPQKPRESSACDHTAWVSAALQRMETIRPGMTRQDLLRVFTTEGGISTALWRIYVSRDCPYFTAEVTFRRAAPREADAAPTGFLQELDTDVIVTISRPYLQFSIMD
jgi:hypothetical protein